MNIVKIRQHMWKNGGSVGIAERKLGKEGALIKIESKNKHGELHYPNTYKVTREQAMSAEIMYLGKSKTPVRIIPISEMQIHEH
tara:strand:+ start:505 stop:756 length:252 start_codon:yes stop_codon:yes gene_type:complete